MIEYESEHDGVGAYVLDALSEEERSLFEAHLASCSVCRAEVAELQQVVDVLPLAVDEIQPSASLRDRVMDAITEDDRPALIPIPGGRAVPRRPIPWRLPEILATAAAVVLLAGLGLWNLHLQQQINDDNAALAYQQQIAHAIANHAVVSPISGVGTARSASAALIQPQHNQAAYLIVQGLPSTPSNRVYELWLFRGKQPTPSRVFTYSGSNPRVITLSGATSGYSEAAVTMEPGPNGVSAPTSPPVLAGALHA